MDMRGCDVAWLRALQLATHAEAPSERQRHCTLPTASYKLRTAHCSITWRRGAAEDSSPGRAAYPCAAVLSIHDIERFEVRRRDPCTGTRVSQLLRSSA